MNYLPSPAVRQWLMEHPVLGAILAVVLLVLLVRAIIWFYQVKPGGRVDSHL